MLTGLSHAAPPGMLQGASFTIQSELINAAVIAAKISSSDPRSRTDPPLRRVRNTTAITASAANQHQQSHGHKANTLIAPSAAEAAMDIRPSGSQGSTAGNVYHHAEHQPAV